MGAPPDNPTNELGQTIGFTVEDWQPCPFPPGTPMIGRTCDVVALNTEAHAAELYDAVIHDADGRNWTYLTQGPFNNFADYRTWLETVSLRSDPLFHTVIDKSTNKAVGIAAYLCIRPDVGVIEVGSIHFSPLLQRTAMSTEAMYLMMKRVFDELGYRRYEWKCDALNEPSNRAAKRLGFTFEGIFRQLTMYKGRNRDTAWYAITDKDWPDIKAAFEAWLDVSNFDADGRQKTSLTT